MPSCRGTVDNHCCWLKGVECPYLIRQRDGVRVSCMLRAELGDWEKVHNDPRYKLLISPHVHEVTGADCGDWPDLEKGHFCRICGHGDVPPLGD